ncbi:helix-turn-helix transcriptional regulator [Paraburkholderia silviterrae]|uniref:LuxR family transcriptional regulator n=1 Tax=Paraburkholderia silviterrae TaxID=2528715 RepID=A0A4V2ZYP4_9BURK|nr:helix-turn-helix transcriptional regulator [Paraburkholderia silviterrae]TDG21425.1 LuxR family transcriptional regulator [Paraburkholderia silviterrae]
MNSNDSQHDSLLHAIYATIERPAGWKDFCAQFRKSIETASVHLCVFDRQRELFSWADGFSIRETEPLELIRPLYRDDARLEWLRAFPPGKWLHCGAHRETGEGHPAFGPALMAGGGGFVSICKLIDSGALTAMIACRGPARGAPLPGATRALLERLAPHLVRAVRLSVRRLLPDADALTGRVRPPAMLVSASGEVLHGNEAAQRLLRATSLVRVRGKRLAFSAPYQARFLEDVAICEARLKNRASGARAAAARIRALRIVGAAETADSERGRAAPLPGGPEVLYAFYNVVTPGEVAGLRALAALTFYHPRSAPAVDEQVLATAFELSPAECRIVHLLVDGLTPKEIAAQVSVQYDTVRKQLQSIFQKTATRRQPDLLRLLMNLPARSRGGGGADGNA